STANKCVRWLLTPAQSSTSTPPGLSMNTRTSRPPGDVSQSTSSYPIGGSVRSNSSPRFTGTTKNPKAKKKWAVEPISLTYWTRIVAEIGGDLKGLRRGFLPLGDGGDREPASCIEPAENLPAAIRIQLSRLAGQFTWRDKHHEPRRSLRNAIRQSRPDG